MTATGAAFGATTVAGASGGEGVLGGGAGGGGLGGATLTIQLMDGGPEKLEVGGARMDAAFKGYLNRLLNAVPAPDKALSFTPRVYLTRYAELASHTAPPCQWPRSGRIANVM